MNDLFARLASVVCRFTGHPLVFMLAAGTIGAWFEWARARGFDDLAFAVIGLFTGVVTFLMVFLIQNDQNRSTRALHAKLDELIRVTDADNKFRHAERKAEAELDALDERE